MGDDWADEQVFETLAVRPVTIKVGNGVPASRASYRLNDVSEVHRLLSSLVAGKARRESRSGARCPITSVGLNGVVTLENDIRLSIPKKVIAPKDQLMLKPGAVIIAEYEQKGSQKVATSVQIKS